ncbi:MAG: hypothetical protein Fur0010_16160 [Bdellovibrio sp.]
MNKKVTAIVSFVLLFGVLIWYFTRPVEISSPPLLEATTSEKLQKPEEVTKTIVIDKKSFAQKDAIIRVEQKNNGDLDSKKAELKKIMAELTRYEEECVASDKQQFPDDRLIDVNDKFYNSTERVIQKLHDSVWGNLNRPISQEARELIKEIAQIDNDADPDEIYAQINALEICRPARTLTFVETVFEAYAHYKWSDKVRQELLFVTYSMFEFVIKKEFSTQNMLLMINLLRSMAENGIIGKEALEEVNRLFTRVVDQEKYLRDVMREGKTRPEKLAILREDLQIKDELGEEILNFARDIRRRFAPDFNE